MEVIMFLCGKKINKMKRTFLALLSMVCCKLYSQNVGIGTNNPAASAQLEVTSTTKGFLPPRVTYVQRAQIQDPVAGLSIWCSDCDTSGQMQVFNGIIWTNMMGAPATKPIPAYVVICSQAWTKKNLDVDHYRNGDPIPQVTDPVQWANLATGAWCWYNNDSVTYAATYGRLYNWYAVNDPRILAPEGWHVPSNAEWNTLANSCAGGAVVL
jgi:Fibrobacter succinogenes major domain (Fib_succ_major)